MAEQNPGWAIVEAEFVAGSQTLASLPPPLVAEVAFAGRSNVGKSSLMNALVGRRSLVRTSSTPGCTRQINFFDAKARDGAVFRLVDLPGYGYAKRSKAERRQWGDLIDGYLAGRETLKAVLVLVDARRGLAEEERQLLEFVRARRVPLTALVVATKIDKVKKSARKAALSQLGREAGERVIGSSATDAVGIETLWRAIRSAAHVQPV
ncbi:MAG: YihA family ribosome biogenesis GTP-binding protein [Myxococcales bacterium]|nr:YihA family ribosome biogenesis GTP-binding protein [Myxococcales bacterium]